MKSKAITVGTICILLLTGVITTISEGIKEFDENTDGLPSYFSWKNIDGTDFIACRVYQSPP